MPNAEIPYRSLGRCGTKVSVFGLGSWTTFGGSIKDKSAIQEIHFEAFKEGINFFDTADVYSKGEAEKAVGEVLRQLPRHELVVSSKVYFPFSDDINDRGLSRKHILESIDRTLSRMDLEYLDIYYCHRFDENTPLEETCRAMDTLIQNGKIFYWGTSEWTGAQLKEAHEICRKHNLHHPQVEQPQYSLLAREKFEKDTAPSVTELGMGTTTWSPLAYGVLTGKYDGGLPTDARLTREEWLRERFYSDTCLEQVKKMKKIADSLGCTRAQLALAFVANHPAVSSVITGATSLKQFRENLQASVITLSEETKQELHKLFAF